MRPRTLFQAGLVMALSVSSVGLRRAGAQSQAPQAPPTQIPLEVVDSPPPPAPGMPDALPALPPSLAGMPVRGDSAPVQPSLQSPGQSPWGPDTRSRVARLSNPFEEGAPFATPGPSPQRPNPFEAGVLTSPQGRSGYPSPQSQGVSPGAGTAPGAGYGPGAATAAAPGSGGAAPSATGAEAGAGAGAAPGAAPGATAAAEGAFAAAAGDAGPGFGGGLGASGNIFAMIGDQGPFSALQAIRFPPIPTPVPPGRPTPGGSPGQLVTRSVNAVVPVIRGFKMADNQSPRPVDRVFVDFNFYDNVNSALNRRLGAPIDHMRAYHEVFGFEKTFLNRRASFGMRVPVNSLSVDSRYPGIGGTRTAAGNLGAFFKYILIQNNKGSLLSTGMIVNVPTGPSSFAGFHTTRSINTTEIQPYLGYILTNGGNWYAQGFSSVSVPTDSALPTLMYIDNSVGYFVYRSDTINHLLTAVAPTFETHLNIPLNHRGYTSDPFGLPTVLDLTFGLNLELFGNSILTFAYIRPVTGPLPFDGEVAVLFNARFGASRRTRALPPVTGG